MKLKQHMTEEKLRGAYYTPDFLANLIVGELLDLTNVETILEPSSGDGAFIKSIIERNDRRDVKIDAVEIDNKAHDAARSKYDKYENTRFILEDFFNFYLENPKSKYDLIIGNPPYIRYQYLEPHQREEMSSILKKHSMKPNKLINSWVGFMVACTTMLSDKGKLAFVVPAEILQVVYARELRKFLQNRFDSISIYTFDKLVFGGIEQEIVIFVGEKNTSKKGIRVIELDSSKLMDSINIDLPFLTFDNSNDKWTKYFTNKTELKLINEVKTNRKFQRLDSVALINVGITTGNNSYFSIDKKTHDEYNLSTVSMKLIGKSAHVKGVFYNQQDDRMNTQNGKRTRLVVFPDKDASDFPLKHLRYIQEGEKNEVNKGYKCSIRDKWYVVPSVWVPDAFFLRRNNMFPKFVLNRCEAVSTDTMHRLKFKPGINHTKVLLSYFNSVSFAFTEICGRSYGGGVLEILPSEVGSIVLPKIEDFDDERAEQLLNEIDCNLREGEDIEVILDKMDEIVLVNHLGYPKDYAKTFRKIWKKMQSRRITRGKK